MNIYINMCLCIKGALLQGLLVGGVCGLANRCIIIGYNSCAYAYTSEAYTYMCVYGVLPRLLIGGSLSNLINK
jgi:uncharacterized membrane protein